MKGDSCLSALLPGSQIGNLDLKAQGKLRSSKFFCQERVSLVMEQLQNNL